MAISAKAVQELRAKTSVGMMDCKRALEKADGDMGKAIEFLRARGIGKAEDRMGRVAKEGLIGSHLQNGKLGVLVEVNSETDFVARTDEFQDHVGSLARHVAEAEPLAEGPDGLMVQPYVGDNGKTIQDLHAELVAKCGENVTIRRFSRYKLGEESGSEEAGVVTTYIHTGSKLGVLLEVGCGSEECAASDKVQTFARDMAMHIAASAPLAVSRDDVDGSAIERERGIFREQALEEGKPENIVDRIVEGRLEKYYQEVCLLEQPFVKNPDRTVKDLLADLVNESGEDVSVRRFLRYVLGEES